jgi:hypothetical protein
MILCDDALMAEVVYVLGAGFSCSILDPSRGMRAPLARNFFQVLLGARGMPGRLDGIRRRLFVDVLLEEIQRYWHLDFDALKSTPFDIEECLTIFESQLLDHPLPDRELALHRARFALLNLLLMHLGELSHGGHGPVGHQFGSDVLASGADVLTFNYDSLAEELIGSASGIGPKTQPIRRSNSYPDEPVLDEDLDASHLSWKAALACGFKFDELSLPIAGVSKHVAGDRYYRHPANQLYTTTRVLKLHGSIDWLTYTSRRYMPPEIDPGTTVPPGGLVLETYPTFWMGESPTCNGWYMEPRIIAPQLYKNFQIDPFPDVWRLALQTLAECRTLIVIGNSLSPTDFRTRRLLLEAFSNHQLENLVVINPDTAVLGSIRELTHYAGPAVSCSDLSAFYRLPLSWFDLTRTISPSSVQQGAQPGADTNDATGQSVSEMPSGE